MSDDVDEELYHFFEYRRERYRKLREFAEQDEVGIRISSLLFDKESYQVGEETTFYINVFYYYPKDASCMTFVHGNIEQPTEWTTITSAEETISKGIRQYAISTTPKQWDERNFGLRVAVQWQEEDYWSYDTQYISIDGELTDFAADDIPAFSDEWLTKHFNPDDYISMTPELAEVLQAPIAAGIAGDYETLKNVVHSPDVKNAILSIQNETAWSQMEDCAIVLFSSSEQSTEIEYRNTSGVGFSCWGDGETLSFTYGQMENYLYHGKFKNYYITKYGILYDRQGNAVMDLIDGERIDKICHKGEVLTTCYDVWEDGILKHSKHVKHSTGEIQEINIKDENMLRQHVGSIQ